MTFWNPFRAHRERLQRERAADLADRSAERDTLLEAIHLIAENFSKTTQTIHATVGQLAAAQTAQAKAFSDHLALFKVSEAPVSRVTRDSDEFAAEIARNNPGIPPGLNPAQQLQWVLDHSTD